MASVPSGVLDISEEIEQREEDWKEGRTGK
jgi:hypothetical protein